MFTSFSYMFKESNFFKRFFMLFAFILIANFLINLSGLLQSLLGQSSIWYNVLLIFGYIFMFVPYGYSIELLREHMQKNDEAKLLDMNFFNNFKSGFKVVVSGLMLLVSVIILLVILGFLNRLLFAKFGILASSFVYTLVFLIFLIISFFMIGMCNRYVIKPSWLNFLNFKAAALLINHDVAKYFKVYLLTAFSFIILGIISVISALFLMQAGLIGFVLYILIISLLWTYLTFVFAKLFSYATDVEKI